MEFPSHIHHIILSHETFQTLVDNCLKENPSQVTLDRLRGIPVAKVKGREERRFRAIGMSADLNKAVAFEDGPGEIVVVDFSKMDTASLIGG